MVVKVIFLFLMPRKTSIIHQDSSGEKNNNVPINRSFGLKLVGIVFASKRGTMNYPQSIKSYKLNLSPYNK